jgi:hypothetical protein
MPVRVREISVNSEKTPVAAVQGIFLLARLVFFRPVQAVNVPEKEREKQDDGGKYKDHSVFF